MSEQNSPFVCRLATLTTASQQRLLASPSPERLDAMPRLSSPAECTKIQSKAGRLICGIRSCDITVTSDSTSQPSTTSKPPIQQGSMDIFLSHTHTTSNTARTFSLCCRGCRCCFFFSAFFFSRPSSISSDRGAST